MLISHGALDPSPTSADTLGMPVTAEQLEKQLKGALSDITHLVRPFGLYRSISKTLHSSLPFVFRRSLTHHLVAGQATRSL